MYAPTAKDLAVTSLLPYQLTSLPLLYRYILATHLLAAGSSATVMNLSLLTSDFWSVVVGVLLLGSQLNGWCGHPYTTPQSPLPPSLPPPDPLCARPRPPVCPSPASEPPSPLCLQVCPGLCPRGGRARLLSLEASEGDVRAAARTAQRAVRTGVRVAAVIRRRLRTKHRIRVRPTLVYIARERMYV